MLELVDGAFDEIAGEVEIYKTEIASKTSSQLSDIELNSLTLQPYLERLAEEHNLKIDFTEIPDDILGEFKAFGLNKIGDLKKIASREVLEQIGEYITVNENAIGFVRTLMMYHDIDRYFTVWNKWTGLDRSTAALLTNRYGQRKFRNVMGANEIWIEGEENRRAPHDSMDDDIPF